MHLKHLWVLAIACIALISCDDNTGTLGGNMMPVSDKLQTHTTTFNVTTESVKVDSVYAKSSIGYIGRFSDPNFGYYESSFISELNCTDNYQFPGVYTYDPLTNTATGSMAGDTIVNIQLVIYYGSFFGDSLNACRLSAYELNDKWLQDRKSRTKQYRYTNLDASQYMGNLLCQQTYTAYDTSVSDSIRYGKDSSGYALYYPNVTIELDKKIGQRILDLNRQHPEYFKNSETFIENVFPGVYLKSDYGDGTILYIDRVDIQMCLRFHEIDESTGLALKKQVTDSSGEAGSDSLFYSTQIVFASTKEVIQTNHFSNSDKIDEKIAETENTYIKSPAGIFTAATIPYDEIAEQLAGDTLNVVKLTFTNYNQENLYDYNMSVPNDVLLIRQKDVKSFFENSEIANNQTSYTATHNSEQTNQYTFNNISRLITKTISEKKAAKQAAGSAWNDEMEREWEKENRLMLIPVTISYSTNSSSSNYYYYYSSSSSSQQTVLAVQHDLEPTYAKLLGGKAQANGQYKNPLTLEVVYTRFKD